MNKNKTIQATVLAIAIAAACSWATAQDAAFYEPPTPSNTLTLDSQNIVSMGAEVDLIIKGPEDFYLRESFGAGEPIEIIPTVMTGGYLPDGTYRYELQIMGIQGMSSERNSDTAGVPESLDSGFGSYSIEGGSGAFSIQDGQVVPSNVVEAPYKASHSTNGKVVSTDDWVTEEDQVIADDVIITNSLCVGFDCVNGESFGFDTIRLKENNLRIKFEDTSVGAFPSTDWQLTANDSANGGANKFSIEDITAARVPFTVEGSAPSNSLYIDDTGRIGLGTSAPVVQAHMVDGNTPTVRLEQDGSSGFTAQTWDVAGNEANFFVRDVTGGSKLPFRIRPGAPTSSIDIAADGDVGIGTASPAAAMHITRTNGNAKLFVQESSTTEASRQLALFQNNGTLFLTLEDTSGFSWNVQNQDQTFRITTGNGSSGGDIEFLLDDHGNLTIPGTITTGGTECGSGCDFVFDKAYELPSITEHAEQMWRNQYLPNVGRTVENQPINLSEKVGGILNELEIAHIYIEQLHSRIESLEARLTALEGNN